MLKLIVLKAKFAGSVRDQLINSLELSEKGDYESFKTKVIKEFETKLKFEEAQSKFCSLRQESKQNIGNFMKMFNITVSSYVQQRCL